MYGFFYIIKSLFIEEQSKKNKQTKKNCKKTNKIKKKNIHFLAEGFSGDINL